MSKQLSAIVCRRCLYVGDWLDPIIFKGLKALTMKDPQQASLLELCSKGIGVYSPHTSVDGAVGGVNDYLVDVVSSVDIPGVHAIDTKPIIPLLTPVEGTSLQRRRTDG
jgi:NIF3 (NGG1p interacting factor 3)